MHIRASIKKLSIPIVVVTVFGVLGLSAKQARMQMHPDGSVKNITVHAVARAPFLNLQDGYEIGTALSRESSGQQSADPVALAAADFDEDGIADLVTGYSGGKLSVFEGNASAIYANSPQAPELKRTGQFNDDPFLPQALALEVPETPDILLAGDFNADGHPDIAATVYNSTSIYLLAGNGHGKFQAVEPIKTKGKVTAATTGQIGRADNLSDLAVGVVSDKGPQLLIYEHPEGAFRHPPEVFNLPAPATTIVLGQFDEDSLFDVAVGCGNKLVIVHGHMQIYPWDLSPASNLKRPPAQVGIRELGYEIAGLAAGHFSNSRRESLALVSTDGDLYLLEAPTPKRSRHAGNLAAERNVRVSLPTDGPFSGYTALTAKAPQFSSAEEAKEAGYAVTDGQRDPEQTLKELSKTRELPSAEKSTRVAQTVKTSKLPQSFYTAPSRIREWHESLLTSEAVVGPVSQNGGRDLITKARISNAQTDDLVVLNRLGNNVQIVSTQPAGANQSAPLTTIMPRNITVSSLAVEGRPIALLPLRLNGDGLSDLVVVRSGSVSPSVVMTTPTATFTVNSTADDVVSNCNDAASTCTLRDAINRANNNPGSAIAFNIAGGGVHTISPFTELPVVGQPVTIDGTTQPGYNGKPVIEIKGNNFPSNHGVDGLKIRASNCVVRGLAINEFPQAFVGGNFIGGNGLTIESLSNQNNGNNVVEGNFLGTDPAGTTAHGNSAANLNIFDSDNNTIGGTSAQTRNVMSGDGVIETGFGIQLLGNNNLVEGNYIGTDAAGNQKLPNSRGLLLLGSNNLIGGDAVGAGNVISGNGVLLPNTSQCAGGGITEGLLFSDDDPDTNLTVNNLIKGNKIGTNATGTAPLGNCYAGISTLPPSQLIIGSITGSGRNIISDNGYGAIDIEAEFRTDQPAGFTAISGDNIGTDITGTVSMPNSLVNQPGGFNVPYGAITLRPNTGSFVNVGSPGGTSPGGACTGFCTLVSGNYSSSGGGLAAVFRDKGGEFGIFSSFVGTDISGTVALPNNSGVVATGETSYIGFPGLASGNLLSGNINFGVALTPNFGFTNYVAGNLVGTDTTGNNALPNNSNPIPFGAAVNGFSISGSGGIVIGGSNASDRNIISGNILGALDIGGDVAVQNNYIGLSQSGAPLPNTGDGITANGFVQIGGSNANLISNNGKSGIVVKGGAADIRGNTITNNVNAGVSVIGGNATIRQNVIANNGDLGIDLGGDGVTANDCDDSDEGPNSLQNYPLLNTPTDQGGGMVAVHGTIKSTPHTAIIIDFYTNTAADPSNYGEGETYAGSVSVTTGPYGTAEFDSPNISAGQVITATATNQDLQTSEFSCAAGLCQQDSITRLLKTNATAIGCVDPIIVNTTGDQDDGDPNDGVCDVDPNQTGNQCTLRAAIHEANNRGGGAFVAFDIPGGGVQTITPDSLLPVINAKVRIDATTQSGYVDKPLIQLDGSNLGSVKIGLEVAANNVIIRGFAINNFNLGILIRDSSNNTIQSCFIGINAQSQIIGNAVDGIDIVNSTGNQIGGPNPLDQNVILGNAFDGIAVYANSPNNTIIGNLIGIPPNWDGSTTGLQTQQAGIVVFSNSNKIGEATATAGTPPGNVICGNSVAGILISSSSSSPTDNNVIAGNLIGITADGDGILGNPINVLIAGNANNNTVGGTNSPLRNVISGDSGYGVRIQPLGNFYPSSNKVQGNFIGTTPDGNHRVGNQFSLNQQIGVAIADASNTVVGGSVAGRNVISGNSQVGVSIQGQDPAIDQAHNNTISGNFIGVGQDGTTPVFNGIVGLIVGGQNARNNTIGGFTAGERNVISGNLNTQYSYGGIFGNESGGGVVLNLGAHDNRVVGNFIGTDASGGNALPNLSGVMLVSGASSNLVGGTTSGARNIISASVGGGGVTMLTDFSIPSSTSISAGNFLSMRSDNNSVFWLESFRGLAPAKQKDFNAGGTLNRYADLATFGFKAQKRGSATLPRQTLVLAASPPTTNNQILGNYIGTDSNGVTTLVSRNTPFGIAIFDGATNNIVGSSVTGARNIISGSNGVGVAIGQAGLFANSGNRTTPPSGNTVQGNFIGTDLTGIVAIPNNGFGIRLLGAASTTIGGTGPGQGNVISGNPIGLAIYDIDSKLNVVQGNLIGTQSNGTAPLGNQGDGVFISAGASRNTIGGTAAGAGNVIMFNGKNGVSLDVSAGPGNMIDPNTISANTVLGISLNDESESPVLNDPGDADAGANNLQNFPEFSSAIINGSGSLVLQYKIDSAPENSNYGDEGLYVEIFKADEGLQGKTFLTSDHYPLAIYNDGTPGRATVTLPNAAALDIHVGDKLVATATDSDGNTSEFTRTNIAIVTGAPTASDSTISGKISMSGGAPLSGVVVTVNGTQARQTITDSNGNYRFDNVETGGFYTLIPSRANYSFNPASRSLSILGARTEAVFTATGNQTESENPIDTAEFFVRQQYLDFLGREPDSGGFDYWSGALTSCGGNALCRRAKRIDVSNAFFFEQEFQDSGAFVYRTYKLALGEPPTFAQFQPDRAEVVGGPNLENSKTAFTLAFVQRDAFRQVHPIDQTSDQFVDSLLNMIKQNSKIDLASQRASLVTLYDGTESGRAAIIRTLAANPSLIDAEYNASFVLTQYFGYLRRDPDPSGFHFWLTQVNSAPLRDVARQHAMVCSFITSAEYQQRFGAIVTHSNLECGP